MGEFVDACLARVRTAFRGGLQALGDRSAARLTESLSVPVEVSGDTIIRSLPGEAPRRETGDLSACPVAEVIENGDGALTDVLIVDVSGVFYAGFLEHGTGNMRPRPFVAPERERVSAEGLEFLSAETASRLSA